MTKKRLKLLILSVLLISFLAVLLIFSLGNNQGNTLDEDNKPDVVESEQESDTDKQSDEAEVTEDEEEIEEPKEQVVMTKYYVNKNYFIKPVNEDDSNKVVLLTFDDTPQGDHTLEILDTLDKYEAKAIFFVNGHYAVKNEDLLKEIYNRGHIIGNHTWWHKNLNDLTLEKTKEEIIEVNNLVEELTGERPKYFRPPFGAMSANGRTVIKDEGMQSMNWSLGSLDWEYVKPEQSGQVVDQVLNNLLPGSNILMHDKEVTALALDQILQEIQAQGYSFVLPTELIIAD